MVSDIGEFSVRGDIIDIFSFLKNPVRIELWGDEITDIRFFNNETQRSIEKTDSVEILPVYKFIADEKNVKSFVKAIKEEVKKTENKDTADLLREMTDELAEKAENETYFEGIEYFQSYFNKKTKNLIELADDDFVIVFDESTEVFSRFNRLRRILTSKSLKIAQRR